MKEFVFSLISGCSGAIVIFATLFIVCPICLLIFYKVIKPIFIKITRYLQSQKGKKESMKNDLLAIRQQKIQKRNIANNLWNELADMCLVQNLK